MQNYRVNKWKNKKGHKPFHI